VYDSTDGVSEDGGSPSPPSSLTHVHRCIGSHNTTRWTLTTSPKLTYLGVYDSRDGVSEYGGSPSPPSSLTDVHRCFGSRNATRQTLTTSVKLTYQSVYVHRYIGSRNGTRKTLTTSVKLTYLSVYDTFSIHNKHNNIYPETVSCGCGMTQPSAWKTGRFLIFSFLVFHHTDTHI
jgi:hypothetical protein